MSIARHHAEWLSLVEANGSFLSLQVLLNAFPQGLEAHDSEHYQLLKQAYEEWQTENYNPAIHQAWIKWVLQETLQYPDRVLLQGQEIPQSLQVKIAEYQENLRPDFVLKKEQVELLIKIVPPEQGLEKTVKNSRWKASPATRMTELLHGCNVRLGLLTNGEQWMLVNAPKGETTGYISWYANLWTEEKLTLRSFRSLLGINRFFGVPQEETLSSLLAQSKDSQQEVTDQLGYQVRKAVEVLVQKIDRIDLDLNRKLLENITDTQLYEAALFVMMRLVFLFSAEEKGLLLLGDRLYDQNYAVSTLRAELREMADNYGEEILERRHDAWCRLLATFRAVYQGVEHSALRLPAYGGDLFNPDKFPFLEGYHVSGVEASRSLDHQYNIREQDALTPSRSLDPQYNIREQDALTPSRSLDPQYNIREQDALTPKNLKPLPVDNRTVLHLLEALQILQIKVPGGGVEPRRLSFRALDVEQIGHVYEGLLDHTAVRAKTTVLGLIGTKNKNPEITLEELETYTAKGEKDLIAFLKKVTGKSESALKKLIPVVDTSQPPSLREEQDKLTPYQESRYLIACHNDIQLWQRIKPFYQLIRFDTFDFPLIIPEGSVYVTQGSDRRETGTHYTPKSLTEEIVKYTLQPLVYEGVAEGKPQEEWVLKPAKEILKLKICDPTMGSGAFLVQVCRYLGQKLVESWNIAENNKNDPPQAPLVKGEQKKKYLVVTPEGELSQSRPDECLIPEDENERLTVAKRIIAERCVYGVDKNPLAVEMAKLSLWLETLQKDKPFTFVDHALKCGDSLIGANLEQLKNWNLDTEGEVQQLGIAGDDLQRMLTEAIDFRLQIEAKSVNTPQDQQEKAYLLTQANARIKDLKDRADLLVSSYLIEGKKQEQQDLRLYLLMVAQGKADLMDYQGRLLPDLNELRPFHWDLEFPEVFLPSPTSPLTPLLIGEGNINTKNTKSSPSPSGRGGWGVRGFNAIVGNPPFMGGLKLFTQFGEPYRDYLVNYLANGIRGNRGTADLSAYFFLRAKNLIKNDGHCGLVATNTISQGDSRRIGLDQIVEQNCIIYRAVPSRKWEGTASLEVAYVWFKKGQYLGEFSLDDKPVEGITSYLTIVGKTEGKPYKLIANQNKSFLGSTVLGMGFVLTPEEAQNLIEKNPKNKDVLFPYLNGQDLNSNPDQAPSRWIINFFDWALSPDDDDKKKPKGAPYASDYPDCLEIVERLVKPERQKLNQSVSTQRRRAKYWWIYGQHAPALYETIKGCDRVLVTAAVSPTTAFHFEPKDIVFSHKIIAFSFDKIFYFSILQSTIHREWAYHHSSTLGKTTLNYSPSDAFETFPFPNIKKAPHPNPLLAGEGDIAEKLERIGEEYYHHRQAIMTKNQEGLTKTYNRFHNPDETDLDIIKLRELHREMDYLVAEAYGWLDLALTPNPSPTGRGEKEGLNHDFHETKQGLRYTICEEARREILDRLLLLNHQRYEEEIKQGLHDKKGKKKAVKGKAKKVKNEGQLGMF